MTSAGVYVDTSALARVMLGEPDADAVAASLATFAHHFASRLLAVELRRVALREQVSERADALLGSIALVPLHEELLAAAESVPPAAVATLDALHLVTALKLRDGGLIASIMTYDHRLGAAAATHGLAVVAP